MQPGEVAVEDDHVIVVDVHLSGGVHAVVGDIDSYAVIAQSLGDIVGQPPDVLHDEHPHAGTPAAAGCMARGRSTTTPRPPSGSACRRSVP